MKSIVTKSTVGGETRYPYLGIHKDDLNRPDPLVVLFTSKKTGIIVSSNDNPSVKSLELGEISKAWDEDSCFVFYDGSVTLLND